MESETHDNQRINTPVARRYTLVELLKDTTPDNYAEAGVDFGPDIGREIVD